MKTQFGFHQETKNLRSLHNYRKYMHMIPDEFPSLDYKIVLSDLSDSDDDREVSFCHTNNCIYVIESLREYNTKIHLSTIFLVLSLCVCNCYIIALFL